MSAAREPYRVMVVDDSAVIRGLTTRWIEADAQLRVVGSYGNGRLALARAAADRPDVIVLDIEMPEMDGIEALPQLIKAAPGVKVVMASTLTRRNAEISMKALSLGAADYVAKPEARALSSAEDYKELLVRKVRGLAEARRARTAPQAAAPLRTASPAAGAFRPQILAIGSSTGGPQALFTLLKDVAPALNVPVVVTQHMPATFTAILAEHIAKTSGLPCSEGRTGEPLLARRIYVAPGDQHMLVAGTAAAPTLQLTQTPPENFCRPAVDPMFRGAAAVFGGAVLGVVLTGMGHDGREGARVIAAAGGQVLAQDEATSVVWGMPGAVAQAGLANAILPLPAMGAEVSKLLSMRRP